ncbi:MAG: hypothetical protein LBG88_03300 [Christensenellaceae bacterium]|jgi:hypothetical protein|nr:hypothetical protein [Christensenellaceae bacterium]
MFANKKLLISIALAFTVFVSGLLGFVIIPNALNKFHAASLGPMVRDSVSGNGGSAVMVGEYLYFTSGFQSKEAITYKQNAYNKVRGQGEGGIWRVKMSNGLPEYNNDYLNYLKDYLTTDEVDGFDRYDRFNDNQKYGDSMDKVVKRGDLELIVPKIAGWENTAIWIFDNTLIYTSPNEQKDKRGQLQRNKIDFFRCSLTGSAHKKIYTTRNDGLTFDDYTVAWASEPYLLIKDGESLNRVSMGGRVSRISDKVISAVFPVVTGYFGGVVNSTVTYDEQNLENSYAGVMSNVYYTEAPDEDQTTWRGDILKCAGVATWRDPKTLRQSHEWHTLHALGNGHLVMQINFESPTKPRLYVINDEKASFEVASLDSKYKMSKSLEAEEAKIYVSGEKTLSSMFRYVTLANGGLRVYAKQQDIIYSPNPITNDGEVESIIAVNSGNIMYKSMAGQLVSIDWQGNNRQYVNPGVFSSAVPGARITAFCVLDAHGRSTSSGYMFFFVGLITEYGKSNEHNADDGHDHGDEESPEEPIEFETITAGFILSPNQTGGRDYILAQLDTDKYVYLPENEED